MNAFWLMFYEPGAEPPRLSLARMVSLILFTVGVAVMVRGSLYWSTEQLQYGGGITLLGAVLYGWAEWRRLKFGDLVEIERGDKE